MSLLIAIQPDEARFVNGFRQSYSDRWSERLRELGHAVRQVDVYRPDIIDQVRGCDGFMWRSNTSPDQKAVAKRLIPVLDELFEGRIFPDRRTYWHYDDKLAQHYLLQSHGVPTPRTWIFWRERDAQQFLSSAPLPLVVKLSGGASSENVQLVRTLDEAARHVHRLFSGGLHGFRTEDRSALNEFLRRTRAAAKQLLRGEPVNPGLQWEVHKNYVLFQEFLPQNAFDTRVVVIGRRAWAFRRFNRANDFRASGSGLIDFDERAVSREALDLCVRTAMALNLTCVAFDVLVQNGTPVIAEFSYAFAQYLRNKYTCHWEVEENGLGEFTLKWNGETFWPEDAMLDDLLARIASRKRTPDAERVATAQMRS